MEPGDFQFGKVPIFNTIDRTYVSNKVFRVKWKPDGEYFVTGSYSENDNSVQLWHYPTDPIEQFGYPKMKFKISTGAADITELKFVDKKRFLYSNNHGELYLIAVEGEELKIVDKWINDPIIGKNIFGFDVEDQGRVAVLTEEGQIACFSYSNQNVSSSLIGCLKDNAKCVAFLSSHEISKANLRGQITVYDMRNDVMKPSMSFPYNCDSAVGVTCLSPFPVRRHMLVAAGMDGTLTTWDLRKPQSTRTVYAGHTKPVSSLVFHPLRPTNAFTTAYSGEVWHWTNFYDLLSSTSAENDDNQFINRSLLYGHSQRKPLGDTKPDVRCLIGGKRFPTNSCDAIEDRLVCSTDNDCLVFVKPLQLS